MFVPVKAKTGFQDMHHKKTIAVTLLIVVLVSSLFACIFMNSSIYE